MSLYTFASPSSSSSSYTRTRPRGESSRKVNASASTYLEHHLVLTELLLRLLTSDRIRAHLCA